MGRSDPAGTGEQWVRSGTCASGTCVEVLILAAMVRIRGTSRRQEILTFDHAEWARFMDQLRGAGGGDRGAATVARTSAGVEVSGHGPDGGKLSFSEPEWETFLEGVRAGEFTL